MTAYNRRFGKAPRHDFDVHRPLETDDDLTAFSHGGNRAVFQNP